MTAVSETGNQMRLPLPENHERCFMNTALSVLIPKNITIQLDIIAKETDKTRSFVIQKALETYIEDYKDIQIALSRLHDEKDEVISPQEMRASLGL